MESITGTALIQRNEALRIAHGLATDCVANITKCQKEVFDSKATITSKPTNDVTITIVDKLNELSIRYLNNNVSIHKMLVLILAEYCKNNNYKKRKIVEATDNKLNMKCVIDFENYCNLLGYKYLNSDDSKNKNNIQEIKKNIKKIARTIGAMQIEWKESNNKYSSRNIIKGWDVKGNTLTFYLNEMFVDYLCVCPQTLIPTSLLSIDEKYPNAYRIGYKIFCYYFMRSNVKKNRNNKLKVITLLNATNIDYITILDKDKKHWRRRIKVVFEKNMNILVKQGILNWDYCDNNGFNSPDDYLNKMINFSPNNKIEQLLASVV